MKKVLVTGIFNVFHPGHVRLLKFAKNCGDKLIVGLLSDKLAGKGSFVSLNYRLENLKNMYHPLEVPKMYGKKDMN